MKRNLLNAAVVAAAAIVTQPGALLAADTIPVGVIANLTGQDVNTSLQMARGVELAADEINAAGGIDGKMIELIVEDSEYKAQEALTAATKLYQVNQVPAVIMFGGSSLMIPVGELAQQEGKVLINTSSSSAKLGDYPGALFSILPLDDIVGKELGQYVYDKGARSIATIVPNNTFGTGIAEAAGAAFEAAGGKIVRKVAYTEGQPDYRADVQAIIAAEPDALVGVGYGDDSRTVFKNARELGFDAPWYAAYPSIFAVENEEWMDGKLSGVDNGGYANDGGAAVLAAYKAKWPDEDEPLAHIYYGYDAMMVLAKAIEAGGVESAEIAEALPSVVQSYVGATGKIVWDDRGQRIDPPLDIIEYKGGKFETVGTIE
ncbi:ABC transporter substrate-binding protein [Bauldia litoralis]|uniref:ABC transporter substrate-binding protein n=3 Tax=Bauldia litoralis TaxID=665467 RepID=UPI00326354EC